MLWIQCLFCLVLQSLLSLSSSVALYLILHFIVLPYSQALWETNTSCQTRVLKTLEVRTSQDTRGKNFVINRLLNKLFYDSFIQRQVHLSVEWQISVINVTACIQNKNSSLDVILCVKQWIRMRVYCNEHRIPSSSDSYCVVACHSHSIRVTPSLKPTIRDLGCVSKGKAA